MSRPGYGGICIDDFLVVHAASLERPDVPVPTHELGVGKVAATASLYALLLGMETRQPVRAVLLCGIAGAYPQRFRRTPPVVQPGTICVVGSDALADEGVALPDGFLDAGAPVFGSGQRLLDTGPFPANPRITADAAARLAAPIVRGATVSTCTGNDALSAALHERTGADVETMEGAAVAYVCRRREVPLLHVRAISNWTGERARGEWNVGAAVAALRQAMSRLFADG